MFNNIDIFLLSKIDLIKLKFSAYYSRSINGIIRDKEDLLKLKPLESQLEEAKYFVLETAKDIPEKFKNKLEIELEEILNEIKNDLAE